MFPTAYCTLFLNSYQQLSAGKFTEKAKINKTHECRLAYCIYYSTHVMLSGDNRSFTVHIFPVFVYCYRDQSEPRQGNLKVIFHLMDVDGLGWCLPAAAGGRTVVTYRSNTDNKIQRTSGIASPNLTRTVSHSLTPMSRRRCRTVLTPNRGQKDLKGSISGHFWTSNLAFVHWGTRHLGQQLAGLGHVTPAC